MIPSKTANPSTMRASSQDRLSRCRRFRAGRCARDGSTSTASPTRSTIREMADSASNRPSGRLGVSAWFQTRGWPQRRSTGPWAAFLPWSTLLNGRSFRLPSEYLIHLLDRRCGKKCRPAEPTAVARPKIQLCVLKTPNALTPLTFPARRITSPTAAFRRGSVDLGDNTRRHGGNVMGLMNFIKGQLIDIIEWTDDSRDTLSFRYPDDDKEIKRGAQLIVRESQVAQFVYVGQFGDTFGPGKYTLTTDNIPVLTSLKGWKYGF